MGELGFLKYYYLKVKYSYIVYFISIISLFTFLSSFFMIILYYHIVVFWVIIISASLLGLYFFYFYFLKSYSVYVLSISSLMFASFCYIFWQFDGLIWLIFLLQQLYQSLTIIQDIDAFFYDCLPSGETYFEKLLNFIYLVYELIVGACCTVYELLLLLINYYFYKGLDWML